MGKFSYFKIGIFVITAIVMGVLGVVVLGAGALFQKKSIVETYIDESVQGLDIGSPVKFRGVPVGRVEDITLTSVEYRTRLQYVLVRISISSNMLQFPVNDPSSPALQRELDRGFRIRMPATSPAANTPGIGSKYLFSTRQCKSVLTPPKFFRASGNI